MASVAQTYGADHSNDVLKFTDLFILPDININAMDWGQYILFVSFIIFSIKDLSLRPEKVFHQCSTFVPEDAWNEQCFRMKRRLYIAVTGAGAAVAIFIIRSSVYDGPDLTPV